MYVGIDSRLPVRMLILYEMHKKPTELNNCAIDSCRH